MKNWMRLGLISAALLCLLMFAPYFLFGARPEWMKVGEIVGYASMFLCLSATWFAMRAEAQRRGGLGFGAALGIGAAVSAVAAVLFGLATILFYSLVGDSLPEALIAFYQLQIRESGAAAEVIAAQLKELESMRPFFYNRPLQGVVMAATVFLIGILESLVGAVVVSRGGRRVAVA